MNNRDIGNKFELLGIEYLKKKGYILLEHQFRINRGEIDIIVEKNDIISFVEVKYRKNINKGLPRESVTLKKQQTIKLVAQQYIVIKSIENKDFSFDVLEILGTNEITIKHLENAFI